MGSELCVMSSNNINVFLALKTRQSQKEKQERESEMIVFHSTKYSKLQKGNC